MIHSVYGIWGDLEISCNLKKSCVQKCTQLFLLL
nr:MAG TPA: hypothetical protein [Caudoviricetes sp.]